MPRYAGIFLEPTTQLRLQHLFKYTIQCLELPVLPLRSASAFWVSSRHAVAPQLTKQVAFLSLRDEEAQLQVFVDAVVALYGAELSRVIIAGIAGGAARSNVATLVEPLKKMITTQKTAKTWIANAFTPDLAPDVADQDKRRFVEKMVKLRGGRGADQVAKEFWMVCRGTNFAFTS
jgi:hypothetical protein